MHQQPYPHPTAPPTPRPGPDHASHWGWLIAIIATLSTLAVPVAFMAMIALAMATDPCHGPDSTHRVCRLTAQGQNFLAITPWITLAAAVLSGLVSAALFARRGLTPLYGLIFWGAGGIAAARIATEIAYLL